MTALVKFSFIILLSFIAIPDFNLSVATQSLGEFKIFTKVQNTYKTRSIFADLASVRSENNSIVFVGDVLLARNVESLMSREGLNHPFDGFDFGSLSVNPFVFGNFEASVPLEHIPTPVGNLQFSVPQENLSILNEVGFTHLSLANNHSYDFGSDSYINTVKSLSDEGLVPFGHPRSIYDHTRVDLDVGTKSVSVFGLHTLFNQPDLSILRDDMIEAETETDIQIAYIHWGEEYELESSARQREYAVHLVDLGFDLIIGHHPHVVQEISLIDGVPVIYSLGNYIFDQYFSAEVQEGLVVKLNFDNEPYLSLVPVSSKQVISQPNMMSPGNHRQFLDTLAEKSHVSLRGSIRAGRISLNKTVATSTKMAIMSQ